MVKSSWSFGPSEISRDLRLRSGNMQSATFDEKSLNLIIYNNEVPVACGSLYFDCGAYHISNICVLPEYRGQYFGDMLVRLLVYRAFKMGAERILLRCNNDASTFFSKYGFSVKKTVGDVYDMEVTAETLILQGSCGHDCAECINKCN